MLRDILSYMDRTPSVDENICVQTHGILGDVGHNSSFPPMKKNLIESFLRICYKKRTASVTIFKHDLCNLPSRCYGHSYSDLKKSIRFFLNPMCRSMLSLDLNAAIIP
jgi:hypothetical protein